MNNWLSFHKYQGTGNDFILFDARESFPKEIETSEVLAAWCHRHTGIGADGVIFLEATNQADFSMRYFNADGKEGSMCGNGSRCATAFAFDLGLIKETGHFVACDGIHECRIHDDQLFSVSIHDVNGVAVRPGGYFVDTGSPHWVKFVPSLEGFPVFEEGRKLRSNPIFGQGGTNVNFVADTDQGLQMATFERGVEAETMACGTGAVAVAMAYYVKMGWAVNHFGISLLVKGGELQVTFRPFHQANGISFSDVWLTGPACRVFSGQVPFPNS